MFVFVSACEYVHTSAGACEQEESVRLPHAGFTGSCEQLDVGTRD